MSKPTHEQLVEATAEHLPTYIGKGISVDPLIENLEPELNISDVTTLLELRFLISGREIDSAETLSRSALNLTNNDTGGITDHTGASVGVLDFITLLGPRLRSIEPAIHKELKTKQGDVDGAIEWPKTIKHRHQSGDQVGSTFVVRSQKRSVQTTQNRVLIRLLQVIRTLVKQLDERFNLDTTNQSTLTPWRSEGALRQTLTEAFENPNLNELVRSNISVSRRDIQDVEADRRPLYREAATLLQTIRDIRNDVITDEQARDLFRMELFAPSPDDGTADLYELYWIFQILEQFDQPHFNQITNTRGQLIAQWETETHEYLLFNDWKGYHRWDNERQYMDYLNIGYDLPEDRLEAWIADNSSEFIRRHLETVHTKYQIFEHVFEYTPQRKSPDIVLLKIDSSTDPATLKKVFIGEVKHSSSRTTILNGVQQLLEYGAFAKVGPHLQLDRVTETDYIAQTNDFLQAPELEMGYFIGDAGDVLAKGPDSVQICGFGDSVTHPFNE